MAQTYISLASTAVEVMNKTSILILTSLSKFTLSQCCTIIEMTAYQNAVEEAHASWLANETTADARWPLRQLHALYNLLIEHREELVNALVTGEKSQKSYLRRIQSDT